MPGQVKGKYAAFIGVEHREGDQITYMVDQYKGTPVAMMVNFKCFLADGTQTSSINMPVENGFSGPFTLADHHCEAYVWTEAQKRGENDPISHSLTSQLVEGDG